MSTNWQIHKTIYLTLENYWVIKKNNVLLYTTIFLNLGKIMLRGRMWIHKDISCIITFIWNIQNKQLGWIYSWIYRPLYNSNLQILVPQRDLWFYFWPSYSMLAENKCWQDQVHEKEQICFYLTTFLEETKGVCIFLKYSCLEIPRVKEMSYFT